MGWWMGYDVWAQTLEAATENGIYVGPSAVVAGKEAGFVVTMLPAGKHGLSVWEELTAAVKPGTLLIDCSTIDVESAREAHSMAREAGCLSLDAPVSGGTVGASDRKSTRLNSSH